MTDVKLSDAELMTTVEFWRKLSPEEQEAILWNFEQEWDAETAARARAALLRDKERRKEERDEDGERAAALLKKPEVQPGVEKPRVTDKAGKVRWRKVGDGWFYSADGNGWRRHLGPPAKASGAVPQLKVIDQVKPKAEELEPEQPEPEPER